MNTTQSIEIKDVFSVNDEPGSEAILAESEKFNEWDINSLIDFIKHYHLDIKEKIIDIYDLAQKVSVRHSNKHPELNTLTTALFLFFDDLLFHLKKEEQILFPNITHLIKMRVISETTIYTTFGLIKESVFVIQKEHQAAVKELKFFRQLTDNYMIPADACNSYRRLFEKMNEFEKELMLHIHLENNILFPKAIQMDEGSTEKEMKTLTKPINYKTM
jgi:regulator of cell morphogenesis and NO signaling